MTLLYNIFMHRITAAAGPGCIQAGPGFVVLIFFFMARLKAFKALGACHPCNYTLDAFKRILGAFDVVRIGTTDTTHTAITSGKHNPLIIGGVLRCLQDLHPVRACRSFAPLHYMNVSTYIHTNFVNLDILRRNLSIDIFCRKNLGCVSDFSF